MDLRRSLPENAQDHYNRSKKLKRKIDGMKQAIADSERRLAAEPEAEVTEPSIQKRRVRKWFEKFRWFKSTEGVLVLGGRDATSNEVLVKKHLEKGDIVFHANIQGAPFFVIKEAEKNEITDTTKRQTAQAAASYSKAWAKGYGSIDVYEVAPDQVSKSPPSGEYLPKGAFMVYGEKTWHKNVELSIAIGISEGQVIGGPPEAIRHTAKTYVTVKIGDIGQGKLAKKIRSILGEGDLDDIQKFLPPGNSSVI